DSGVLIAAFNKKDIHHQAANKIITAITQNKLKNVFISDNIFDEVVTYIKKKYKADFAIQIPPSYGTNTRSSLRNSPQKR
ncbi:MAG: hypothetical protein ACTSYU_04525, partial [Promethearchaeota archaeon]